ncbi:MAG: DNA/RNA helicase domain-containing protein [Thermoplasmataceae archaeon]
MEHAFSSCLYYTESFQTDPTGDILGDLNRSYERITRERPDNYLRGSWTGSINAMKAVIPDGVPVAMEYIFPIGNERVDFLVIGKRDVAIVETKGWRKYRQMDRLVADTDLGPQPVPCYQSSNYLYKFRNFHTAAREFNFRDVVFMYNTTDGNDCTIYYEPGEFSEVMTPIIREKGSRKEADLILNGRFSVNSTLIDFISRHKQEIMADPLKAFSAVGYGLSGDQMKVLSSVLESLKSGRKTIFLIRGKMGSGKTLVALNIILEAIRTGYFGLISYRNNRLINTMRRAVPAQIRPLIRFYSTGPMRNNGIGEPGFRVDDLSKPLDFIVFDEAQRMSESVIDISMTRSRVGIYFYDENQILVGGESGTRENFLKYAARNEADVREFTLNSVFRNVGGERYSEFVEGILGDTFREIPEGYDFRIFEDMDEMIRSLDEIRISKKVALVASFTESDGRKEKLRWKNPDISWLMDETTEYPQYWIEGRDALTKCASVYGAQGFEADYAGIIWGKDLIWRNSAWTADSGAIMDNVGGRNSLRSVAVRDPASGLSLLKNRYRIMLTRGIEGTFVLVEDQRTRDHLMETVSSRLN